MTPAEMAGAHLRVARQAAKRYGPRVAGVMEFEDAFGYACVGLMRAAHTFDPARGVEFGAYAWPKCVGAILDAARVEDAGLNLRSRRDYEAGHPGRRGPSFDQELSTASEWGLTYADVIADPYDFAATIADRDFYARIDRVIDTLPMREAASLRLSAVGWKLEEIADLFGISYSRVSQIRTKAAAAVREAVAA